MTEIEIKLDSLLPSAGPHGDMKFSLSKQEKVLHDMKQKLSAGLPQGASTEEMYNRVNTELSMSLPNLANPTKLVVLDHAGDVKVRNSLSNLFDHYNSAVKDVSRLSNALSLDVKVRPLENGDTKRSSLSLDNPNSDRARHDEEQTPDTETTPEEMSHTTNSTDSQQSDIRLSISSGKSPTTLVSSSMQSYNTDTVECNGSLNSTLTDSSSQFELNIEEEYQNDQANNKDNVKQQCQSLSLTSSQESLHEGNNHHPSQHDMTLHDVTLQEDDDSVESATESTKLRDSSVNSPVDSATGSSMTGGLTSTSTNDSPRTSISTPPLPPVQATVTGDGSSFSSISSLSTSTDLSVSVTTTTTTSSSSDEPTETGPTQTSSPLPTDEQGFVEISLDTRNSFEPSRRTVTLQDSAKGADGKLQPVCGVGNAGAKPKRSKGFTSFLSRSLFSRRPKEQAPTATTTSSSPSNNNTTSASSVNGEGEPLGWKLFGKIPPKTSPETSRVGEGGEGKDVEITPSSLTNMVEGGSNTNSTTGVSSDAAMVHKKEKIVEKHTGTIGPFGLFHSKKNSCDLQVLSTTALILEQRPQGLPSKDPEEEQRHRQMYEQMVEGAKKKEQKDAKLRKKQLEQQLKNEDALGAALTVWNTEVLNSWDTMHTTKRVRELWWSGVPPSVRGKVWKLAIGNDLNLTQELYHICLNRAKERLKLIEDWCGDTDSVSSHMSGYSEHSSSREASVELIKLDVSRTFPQLCIFQRGGPYHEQLQGLLGAYACYRPDVGYVQGMSFIAAVLLLNMEVAEAFICFANLLNRPCQIAFFRLDELLMRAYFYTYEALFEENLPQLYSHFNDQNLSPDLYIIDWMFTLYAKSLPLDVAARVWDVFCRDGEEFLFRTALGLLRLYEDVLYHMDFIHLAQYLTKLPDTINADSLFRAIDSIAMTTDKRQTFQQILTANREAREALARTNSNSNIFERNAHEKNGYQ